MSFGVIFRLGSFSFSVASNPVMWPSGNCPNSNKRTISPWPTQHYLNRIPPNPPSHQQRMAPRSLATHRPCPMEFTIPKWTRPCLIDHHITRYRPWPGYRSRTRLGFSLSALLMVMSRWSLSRWLEAKPHRCSLTPNKNHPIWSPMVREFITSLSTSNTTSIDYSLLKWTRSSSPRWTSPPRVTTPPAHNSQSKQSMNIHWIPASWHTFSRNRRICF